MVQLLFAKVFFLGLMNVNIPEEAVKFYNKKTHSASFLPKQYSA